MTTANKTYEVRFSRQTCGPYVAASIADMVRGLEAGQRITLTKITENVYEAHDGRRFTITEVAADAFRRTMGGC